MNRTVRAKYLIETVDDLHEAAAVMAGEQSTGTFLKLKAETDDLKARHAAEVVRVEQVAEVSTPSLPGAKMDEHLPIKQAMVELAWPFENMGANLSNLCATVAGNLYELKPFSGLKLLDIEVPSQFGERYPGPAFGINGTRVLTGVIDRPVIGTIIKPSVGLSPEQTASQVRTLIEAGLDFIKDDELMGDPPHSPFEERVSRSMEVINRWADRTGKKPMYAFNISGDLDDMRRRHDFVLEQGGTCIMVSVNWVGISAVAKIREHAQLPIHGHRNGWGLMTRSPALGMEFTAFQKIWRLAGIDHLHTNGIRNKFCESDESVIQSVKACLTPFLGGYEIMPVIASGQWAGQAVDTYNEVGSNDLMYLCGGGIVGHPDGIAAGVLSVRQAWEAALQGESLEVYAQGHPELRKALEFYG
ncbi:MAG: ribulose-bisphosphate carboxylase large subunit family protein [Bacteroidota bacterium]